MAQGLFRLRGAGTKGIVNDIPPYDLPPDTWSGGKNVRFEAGRVQKVGGWVPTIIDGMPYEVVTNTDGVQALNADGSMTTTAPAKITKTKTPLATAGIPMSEGLIYGLHDSLWKVEGTIHTDVSATGAAYKADAINRWQSTTISNAVVMNNPNNIPQGLEIDSKTGKFVDIPGWGYPLVGDWDKDASGIVTKPKAGATRVDWSAQQIVAFRNHLVALSIQEGSNYFKQRVRWSDRAAYNRLPTNWISDDENYDGGFNDLTDCFGEIKYGLPLRNSLIIYTDRDTFAMDPVEGNDVFTFRKIFPDSGILAPGCAVEFEQGHFVISQEDIFVHDGSERKPVAASRVKDYLLKEIASVNYSATRVYVNTNHREIWITYVAPGGNTGAGDTDNWACNKAAIWNWQYDTWSYVDLPYIYDIVMHVPPDTDKRQWANYTTVGKDEWNAAEHTNEQWSQVGTTFTKRTFIAPSIDGCFYILDKGFYASNVDWVPGNGDGASAVKPRYSITATPIVCELVKWGIDFDEQEPDISYNKWWRTLYPQMGGQGTVWFSVGGAEDPYSQPIWDSSQPFEIGTDFKVDCWSNWKYMAVKIQDLAEGDWNFTGFDVDYFREGNR